MTLLDIFFAVKRMLKAARAGENIKEHLINLEKLVESVKFDEYNDDQGPEA